VGSKDTKPNLPGLIWVVSRKLRRGGNGRIPDAPTADLYEIRPRKDRDGVDLVSDLLRHGPIWYAGPDAVRSAVAYAKFRSLSRKRQAIIRVLDQSGTLITTH
jgi:hypothetical protein